MLIEVEVVSFAIDPTRNSPLLVLREMNGKRSIAIPIGPLEASAIAIQSLNMLPDKLLTIDLVKVVMEQVGSTLSRVVIYDLVEQSYLSRIQIGDGKTIKVIECRPCDAIALALRCKASIYIHDTVFEKSNPETNISEAESLRRRVASIDTLEFGNYLPE